MSILSVDNISPIGSGTSVTVNSVATLEVNKLNVSGISTFSGNIDVNADLDVDGHTNLDNVSISGVTTCSGQVNVNVNASQSTSVPLLLQNSAAAGTFSNPDVVKLAFGSQGAVKASIRADVYGNGNLTFHTNNDTEKLRITADGKVGIGTNNPSHKIDISGDGVAFPSAAGSTLLRLRSSAGTATLSIDAAAGSFSAIQFGDTAAASMGSILYNHVDDSMKFNTGGTGEKLRIASDGDVGIGTNSPVERLHVHKASATGPFMYITNTSTGVSASDGIQIGYDGTNTAVFKNNEPTDLVFYAGSQNFRITSSGHVLPATNNTQDLGSTAKGWRNVYMNDLNLSNMNGDTNDVDGTQGSWTIQEGKDDLYIINRLNGKKFKIKMEEIS